MKSILLTISLLFITVSVFSQQGICGKVTRTSGNQMPGPDKIGTGATPIANEIYIYEATTNDQVHTEDRFYSAVTTRLIKKIKSKSDGTFTVKLPPGIYSVFIKEKGSLWANMFDGQGCINPVEVTKGSFTSFTINVNFEAAF